MLETNQTTEEITYSAVSLSVIPIGSGAACDHKGYEGASEQSSSLHWLQEKHLQRSTRHRRDPSAVEQSWEPSEQ